VKNGPPGCASRTSNSLSLRRNMSKPALVRLRLDFESSRTPSPYVGTVLNAFLLEAGLLSFFASPEMKSVSENYIAKQIVL